MAENHELFDLVALYFLKQCYEPFPVPANIFRQDVIAAVHPSGGQSMSEVLSYTPGFLERNGYIHIFGQATPPPDGTPGSGWRVTLHDKGLLALKKPSLARPSMTVYERITGMFAAGIVTIGQDTASGLMTDVLSNYFAG